MFGRKKKKEEEMEEPEKKIDEIPFQSAMDQREEQQIQPIQQIQKPQARARITGCKLFENGLMEFTFIANAPMGEIGQEFDL